MLVEPEAKDPIVLSYLQLRKAVGIVAVALPFALAVPWFFLRGHIIETSISGYYYTGMRNLFVGSLCAIAMFMLCCRGYDRKDEIAGMLSSIFALGVAFFPTSPDGHPTPRQIHIGNAHYTFAALLFLTLAYFCLFLFKMTAADRKPTRQKKQRNVVYTVCGWVIIASISLIALLSAFLRVQHLIGTIGPVFCFETTSLFAFGFAWLVKGETFLKDEAPSARGKSLGRPPRNNSSMTTYVLGAGASYPIYPLASELLRDISDYILGCGKCFDRFDYADWPKVMAWLAENPNPLLRRAFENRNIEQIFTLLDLAESLLDESLIDMLRASKKGANAVAAAQVSHEKLAAEVSEYRYKKRVLMWALEAFFQYRHNKDHREANSKQWETLRAFGQLLQPGDTVVTFNYDTTVERVLLELDKWSPADGYGERLVFQSRHDRAAVTFADSQVKVLHLHGAVGWYRKPSVRPGFSMKTGGAIPPEERTPGPIETKISVDPLVLRDLGINTAVDASMPERPSDEYQVLLHPSFLKDYSGEEDGNPVFIRMWRTAAEALRCANRVVIIGYSLPPADSAAWTLLLANCDAARTTVVNPDPSVMGRYRRLLIQRLPQMAVWSPPQDFANWVAAQRQTAGMRK